MKTCYLDANVLIGFGDKGSYLHKRSVEIITKLVSNQFALVLTSLTLDEYEYIALRSFKGSRIQALQRLRRTLQNVFKLPGIELVNPPREAKRHLKVIYLMEKFKLKPRDAYHLFIILENKITHMATFDSDFKELFATGRIKSI